ncbi:MAG: hypothetical protein ACI8TE_000966 [Francisella sp.]|jgi:hypothetical protein
MKNYSVSLILTYLWAVPNMLKVFQKTPITKSLYQVKYLPISIKIKYLFYAK